MKHTDEGRNEVGLELCERCASACDAVCIAEAERDRFFENLLRYGARPL
jgi:hypothetical protein